MVDKLLYRIKNNKLLSGIIFAVFAIILFDLFVIIFDIVQLVKLSNNAVDYMSGFVAVNVTGGVFSLIGVGLVVFYLIFRRKTLKSKTQIKAK